MTDNIASALCYVMGLLTGILFLVLEPYNKNKTIRFHAFQSIFFNVAVDRVRIHCALDFGASWCASRSGAGWPRGLPGLRPGCPGGVAFLMYKAYNNQKFKLPIIGDLAEKQA